MRPLQAGIVFRFAAAASTVAVLIGLLAGGTSFLVMRSFVWQTIVDRLDSVAGLAARRAELIFEHIATDVAGLARNPVVATALVDSRGREVYLRPLLKGFQEQYAGALTIGLYDFRGVPSEDDAPNPPVPAGDPSVMKAVEGNTAVRIEDGSLVIALPIIFPATQLPEGALAARVTLAPFLAKAGAGKGYGTSIELAWPGNTASEVTSAHLTASKDLVLSKPLNSLALRVIVRADEEKALEPLAVMTRTYIAIGIITSVSVFILAMIVGRRLAGPLVGLSKVARAIAIDGRFDHDIRVEGKDEVADLASALKAMLYRLEQSQRELETRVEERTTELRAKERELSEQASRLSAILGNVVDGIITIDQGGTMLSVNPAAERLFGYSAQEMLGRNVSMLMPEPHRSAHDGYLARYLSTGEGRVIGIGRQLAGARRDGSLFPMELAVTVIHSECPVFVGVVRDITERVKAQEAMQTAKEAAEEANREKSEFLATMTHEIRTPMNGVLGMLNILLHAGLPPPQRRHAEVAHRSARSLLTLINDILDFSKIEAGRLTLEVSDFELPALVAEVVENIGVPAQDKGIAVACMVDAALPQWLRGDRSRLLQVLLNLLSNAVKFTEAGSVSLRTLRDGDKLRFEVIDTGIGIAVEDQQRLFTRFTQVEGSYTRKYGGTGLGLAISHRLVEAMDGAIGVASAPGEGSMFWFSVPLLEGSERQTGAGRTEWQFTGHVLLADDSETNQLVAVSLLERTGLTVDCVGDGRAAVQAVQGHGNYDLVLMDIAMPEMDGLTATRLIRALPPPLSDIPIIAMTAFAMTGDAEKCLEAGMNDFVTKPVDPPVLYAKIAGWLGGLCEIGGPAAHSLDDSLIQRMEADTDTETTRRIAGKVAAEIETRSARLAEAALNGDIEVVARETHTLKSLAATFGAERLRTLATDLEMIARNGAIGDTREAMEAAGITAAALRARFNL